LSGRIPVPRHESRIEHDLEYLQHWSLTLDLMIILKTALVVWNDKHAY